MSRILLFIFLILFLNKLYAQKCAHDLLHNLDKKENPELYKEREEFKKKINEIIEEKKAKIHSTEEILTIPVVVHIIHNNASGTIGGANNTNISDAQVFSQIQILNEDYRRMIGTNGYNTDPLSADTKIEFCLASLAPNGSPTTGIVRVFHPNPTWSVFQETSLKSQSYWPSHQYLNIWVCKLSGGVLGYAPYPSGSSAPGLGSGSSSAELDGVVVDFRAFGNTGAATSPYNLGRTTTHEVGHWLGLIHLWGDSGADCDTDYVADTPLDEGPNLDLDCHDSSDCDNDNIYIQDLVNNYMDYSTDICMNLFTVGQKDRIRAVMESAPRRLALKNSSGCCTFTTLKSLPHTEGFETTSFLSDGWEIIDVGADNTEWTLTSPGAYNESSNSIFMENDLSAAGEMDYLVTPAFSFAGARPWLEFDMAYAADPFISTSDTLVIAYNSNCKDWNILASYYGPNLITTTATASNFTPTADDWKKIRLELADLNNKSVARLRFENRSGGRSNLFLDNINIYKTSDKLQIRLFPNPATDLLNIEVIFSGEYDVTYEMYDLIGQKVFQVTDQKRTSHIRSFDVTGITRGMYIIKVSIKGQSATGKVLINY